MTGDGPLDRTVDTARTELPPLYDAINPDALDTLFVPSEVGTSATHAFPVEVVFSWCDHGVRLRETGEITIAARPVTPAGATDVAALDRFACSPSDDATPAYHAWVPSDGLATDVVLTVADVVGTDPSKLREQLADRIHPEALTALFTPTPGGSPRSAGAVSFAFEGYLVTVTSTGVVTLIPELEQLKYNGGNFLVVGDVPDAIFEMARTFLCEAATSESAPARQELLALLDKSPTDIQHQGTHSSTLDEQLEILTYQTRATVRSPVSTERTHESSANVTAVTGGLQEFRTVMMQMLANTDPDYTAHESDGYQLYLDSLRPLLADIALDECAFLDSLCRTVRGAGALGYYFVPRDREAAGIDALESVVDAVIELRVSSQGPEQRWHLQQTGYTTKWFTLAC